MPYCDVIDPQAQAIGSVNTLCRRSDGKLYAWNTDARAFPTWPGGRVSPLPDRRW